MKLLRRRFLRLTAGAAAFSVVSRMAQAQTYPSRPVRILVGFPAGGTVDILARLMGQWLSERLGQPFVIENRPGAGGNIATEVAVRAPADGHTLLAICSPNAINASLFPKLSYNFIRDIAPLASTLRLPNLMAVHPSVPAKNVPEFIAYAKANPGKISMASAGNGTSGHLSGELFKSMTGVEMIHVPYRGGPPAVSDLIAGRVQVLFDVMTNSLEQLRAGKLRALAVTTEARSQALPEIPTVGEFVPGYEASFWNGLAAPRGTSDQVVQMLSKEINLALAEPKMRARLAALGGTVLALSPGEFATFISAETDKWAKVVKFAGIRAG